MDLIEEQVLAYNNLVIQYQKQVAIRPTNLDNCISSYNNLMSLYNRLTDVKNSIKASVSNLLNSGSTSEQNARLTEIYNNIGEIEMPTISCDICVTKNVNSLDSYNDLIKLRGNNASVLTQNNTPTIPVPINPRNTNGITQSSVFTRQPSLSQPASTTTIPQQQLTTIPQQQLTTIPQQQPTISQPTITPQSPSTTTPVSLNYLNELISSVNQTGEIPLLRPGLTDTQKNSILQILESSRGNVVEGFSVDLNDNRSWLFLFVICVIVLLIIAYFVLNKK